MNLALTVQAFERGVIRLFTPDMNDRRLAAILPPHPVDAGHLAPLLGLSRLAEEGIDRINLSDLSDLTLSEFLQIGHDLPAETLAPRRQELDALKGHLFLLHSSAFGGKAVTISPAEGLTFLGAFRQTDTPPAPITLPEAERPAVLTRDTGTPQNKGKGTALPLLIAVALAVAMALYLLL